MKWKIVLVPFPFDDQSGTKIRPALCLTDNISPLQQIVIAFITTQIGVAAEPTDILLSSADHNFYQTGLKADSAVRLHHLVTMPKRLVLRELGSLPIAKQADVASKLKLLFGI